jgi:dipeptidyl aminopeptidase/acylaminoacyl peptidase
LQRLVDSAQYQPLSSEVGCRLGLTVWIALTAFALFAPFLNASTPQSLMVQEGETSGPYARASDQRPFTVADSIEMTHITDPWEDVKGAHPQFSPDGEKFFIVTERGKLNSNLREYSLVIFKINALDKPVPVAILRSSSNRPGISLAKWLTNDNISFIGENPGEVPQVYVVNCLTQKVRKLTADALGVAAYDVTRDLETVIYSARSGGDKAQTEYKDQHGFAIDTERLPDLASGEWKQPSLVFQTYVLKIPSGKTVMVKNEPFAAFYGRFNLWLSPDGKYAITERPAYPVPQSWESYEDRFISQSTKSLQSMRSKLQISDLGEAMLVDTDTGEIKPLVAAPLAYGFSVLWSPDSRSVIVGGTYLPLDGNSEEELAKRRVMPVVAEFTIPSLSFRRIADIPKGQVWFLEGASDQNGFVVHDEEPQEGDIYKALPSLAYRRQGDNWVRQTSERAPEAKHPIITVTQALDRWPRLIIRDPATHQETVITDPNPQFQHRRFGRVQTIHWPGKQGEPLTGGLVYPTDYEPGTLYPLVIQTHGFDPENFLLDGPFTTAMAAQELANNGILVLQIGEGPRDEQTDGTPEEGPSNLFTFETAVDYLDKLGVIDRSRVGLLGFSKTVYHVMYALTESRYHFCAATIAEGGDYSYWSYLVYATSNPIGNGMYRSMYGRLPWLGNWKPWMEHSISFNFDKIHTPLRLEANENPDEIISEWETFTALRLLNRPVDLIFIPNGDHPVVKPWERMTSQQGDVDWFVFWLKGEEDPDPTKAEQYARWRELRRLQQQNSTKPQAGSAAVH